MPKSNIISVTKRCCTQPFVIVGCLIEKNGKFLLVKEGGKWNQPAGWLELREDIIRGAQREVEEETGLQIKITGFLGVYNLIKQKKEKTLHAIKFIFLAKSINDKIKSEKALEKNWFTAKKIQALKNQLWDMDVLKEIEDYTKGSIYPLEIFSSFTDLSNS